MKRILLLFALFSVLSTYNAYAAEDSVQENFSVSAVVPPQTSDYQFTLSSLYSNQIIPQSTQLAYILTYGAYEIVNLDSTMTIVADWRSSDVATNVPLVEYILGSATNAYGNISPIIDLNNRTISWNQIKIPAGTIDQTLKFDLITTSAYTGSNDVPFTVRANMNSQFVTMNEIALTKTYRYESPSSTTTTSTTSTPTMTTTTPSTTSEVPSNPRITNASFTSITDSSATILLDTNKPVTAKISYGQSSRSLPLSVSTINYALRNRVTLDNFLPGTTYYLRILLTDEDSNNTTSEIFTFQTAEKSTPPDLEDNIIVVTSGGNILLSDTQKQHGANTIALLTPDSDYELNYALRKKISLRSIDAVVRNKVLGITSTAYAQEAQTTVIPMTEKSPSTYFASLKTLTPGIFEVSIRIVDTHGNIIEQKVAELKVMSYLSIFEEESEQPISDSRVFLSYYNNQSGKYEPLPREIFSNIPNPSYSNINGAVKINLPPGKYQALASAFGYDQKRIEFTLGPNAGEDFPKILLRKNQADVVGYLQYYGFAISDLFTNITLVASNLAFSVRFFNLLATFILTVTISITFVFFLLRTRLHLRHIFPFFTHHLKTITKTHPLGTFCATITDEQGKRLQDALISVLDDVTGELLTSIASNTIGICYLFNPKEHKNLKLLIIKQGYMPKTVAVESDIADTPNGLTIVLKKGSKPKYPGLAGAWMLTSTTAGLFFEVSLFVSLILELFFFSIYGFTKTIPFFVLSLFNLILWIFYQREKQERKVFKKQ